MSIRKKNINIFFITVLTVFVMAEGLFLFLVPALFSGENIFSLIKQKTNLTITCDQFKIKTYPNFSAQITMKNIEINDEKNKIVKSENTSFVIKPLSFLQKKVNIKSLYSKNSIIYTSKQNDNNLYLGKIPLHKLQKTLENFNLQINNVNTTDTKIQFKDFTTNQTFLTDISSANFNYKKNKYLQVNLESKTTAKNIKPIETVVEISSKLPFNKGMSQKDFICKGHVKNLNIKPFQPYIEKWYETPIVDASGLFNIEFNNENFINFNADLNNFKITAKNNLDSFHYPQKINFSGQVGFEQNNLILNNFNTTSNDWDIKAYGNINNFIKNNFKKASSNITIDIANANLKPLYLLVPSIKNDDNNTLQKIKKYDILGVLNGQIKISGVQQKPEIHGHLDINNINFPNITKSNNSGTANIDFLKDKLKLDLKIYSDKNEHANISGIAELSPNGKGEFKATSTKNIDLTTAHKILLIAQEILNFELGPLPFMSLQGAGEFDLDIKGAINDNTIDGKFFFKNATATIDGLNTILKKGNGSVIFKQKNITFQTNSVEVNNQPLEIKGVANHNGDIDFNIKSEKLKLEELFNILNTSPMLEKQKTLTTPIEFVTGNTKTNINVKGVVKDFSKLKTNNTLDILGELSLENATIKLKEIQIPITSTNGKINFNNDDWGFNLNGYCTQTSKININGYANNHTTDIKLNGNHIKIKEIIQILTQKQDLKFLKNLPETESYISFDAQYKAPYSTKDKSISFDNINATGQIHSTQNSKNDFEIIKGYFTLKNGTFTLKDFNTKLFKSTFYADTKIEKIFTQKPIINGIIKSSDFDVASLNALKTMHFMPNSIKNILNAYENYSGNADAIIKCKNNYLDGYINLKNVKFRHSHFKTPITIDSGKIILDGSKVFLKSIIAQIDTIPTFLNLSIYDIDKTMKINGYFTTKFTEFFANKYINPYLSYPIKPKGDITITTNITGTPNSMTIQPKIKLAEGADIYYMGANFGDETNKREIFADINIIENSYNIKKLNYIRYMTSQNDKVYPLTIINAQGEIEQNPKSKNFYIKNLNINTINNANAKMFNIIFKKSILKNGMFNCKLNIKGELQSPQITGKTTLENIDMPLYQTFIKNLNISFNEKNIKATTNILSYNSDIKINVLIKNTMEKPYSIEEIEIKSDKLNLDTLIDTITAIPTPNTTTKLIEHVQSTSIPLNIADIQIEKGSLEVKDIIIKDLPAKNYKSNFSLGKNLVLDIPNLEFDITTGKMAGLASYDFKNDKIKADIKTVNVDANQLATSLLGFENQIFGNAKGHISITTNGNSQEERIKNMTGVVYFEISDGKMPKLGSVEYLLKAGNFIKSGITGASINNLIELLNPIKTGSFDSIKGKLSLKNGVAQDIEIYSKGENLNMFINGEYDILQKYANMRVFGRLTRKATGILGPVGNISFNSILNSIPGLKLSNKDKDSILNDLNKIPGVELNEKQYRIFTVKIDGQMNDDDKFVKNFRWLE